MSNECKQRTEHRDWDQQYVEDQLPWDTGEPDPHLAEVIEEHEIAPGRALEVGCGTGTNAIWLAEQGFVVTGVDISETAIARAEAKAAEAGVECQLDTADFLADPVPGAPFDFVYDRGVFHLFDRAEERTQFAANVAESLASDGTWHSLIGSTDGPPRDSGPPRRSAVEVVSAAEPHFEIVELKSTAFDQGRHSQARAWVLVARPRESTNASTTHPASD